jgi:hypothetical protein
MDFLSGIFAKSAAVIIAETSKRIVAYRSQPQGVAEYSYEYFHSKLCMLTIVEL